MTSLRERLAPLVQQWRDDANNAVEMFPNSELARGARSLAIDECADELETLLAEPEAEEPTDEHRWQMIESALKTKGLSSDGARLAAIGCIANSRKPPTEADLKRSEELAERFGWEREAGESKVAAGYPKQAASEASEPSRNTHPSTPGDVRPALDPPIESVDYQARSAAANRPCGHRTCVAEFPGMPSRWCSGCLIDALLSRLTAERSRKDAPDEDSAAREDRGAGASDSSA